MQKTNKKIRNATVCQSGNITFKSKLEKTTYNCLFEQGFKPQYEPKTYVLWEGFSPITPFYDKESDSQQEKRLENGGNNKNKILVHKKEKIIGIRYTPDFYFKYGNLDVYIESKGFENSVFYIKKKMFRYYLDEKYKNTGQHSIYFEIYSKKQLLQAIDIIKDYEKTIRNNKETDTNSIQER